MIRQILSVFFVLLALMNTACVSSAPIDVKLHVVGNDNKPVADADVVMSFLLSNGSNISKGTTDVNGFFKTTNEGVFGVSISISKRGFYRTGFRSGYGDQELTLILREKKNPVSMYAKSVVLSARETRISGKEFGYDLMIGDFVSPHGKGIESDLLITHTYEKKDSWNYKFNIDIRFSNPEDGFIPFYLTHEESVYKSDYIAPKDGYVNTLSVGRERRGLESQTIGNWDAKRNYFLRVRSVVNDEGRIESAHYGKIYGELPSIAYYLNPTPNDLNLEFDPQKNLFKNLKPGERPIVSY